jgi:predicted unusual protein kinase regulating ubiquinone biosynthesis (AarF/ABC1/UbiB family)
MISYCIRLFKQIRKLYKIKTHLDKITLGFTVKTNNQNSNNDNDSDNNNDNDNNKIQQQNFESLKQIIFENGSLYIKFFQWYISKLKANIINNNTTESQNTIKFITYFEDIFEQCPYHDLEHTKSIFTESTGGIELEEYIDISTFKPIASGSIGQIYYGRRKEDGLEVAIKVKHPNIEVDLSNQSELIQLIKVFQSISFFRNRYNLFFNLDDFLYDINLQCDFNNEANNSSTFSENFKDSSHLIIFPKVIYQSEDLLISEYIEGTDFNELTDMQKFNTTLNFTCFFYQMLFVDNFIHGDLHCKNWKVRLVDNENNNSNINRKQQVQIIVYDCGICFKNINLQLSQDFWFSLIKYDISEINKVLQQFIKYTNPNCNNYGFEDEINKIFENVLTQSMGTSIIMKSIISFFRKNDIQIHKFLLNFSILICVVEEFLKANDIIDRDKNEICKTSMFDIINDNELDLMTFCDVKKCYPKVRDLFALHKKDKFTQYKNNLNENEIKEELNSEKRLFSSISLSGLIFKNPE